MSDAAAQDTGHNTPVDAPELAPNAPSDPAHIEARAPADPAPKSPAPDAPQPEPIAPQKTSRDDIAKRFTDRRREHDAANGRLDDVPFVERQEADAQRTKPAAPPAEAEPKAPPVPAQPDTPKPYALKVRGKDISVDRAELLRLAEVEPHEEKDFDDARLVRIAQKNAAAFQFLDDARSQRDQARVAAPAPAAPQAGDPQQATPKPAEAPSLDQLRAAFIEKSQIGTPEEASKAFADYEAARDQRDANARDAQSRQMTFAQESTAAVEAFRASNPDLASNATAGDFMMMAVAREIESDLRSAGLSDADLAGHVGNPAAMDRLYEAARQHGLKVRGQRDLLDAAGSKTRTALKFGTPPASPSPVAPSRVDEKRGLQAQPTRSGNPQPVTPQPLDIDKSRRSAIEAMQRGRSRTPVPA